jgi:hypothetical protein
MRKPAHSFVTALAILVAVGCAPLRKDFTRGEANICEVHHQKMQKTVVPVTYGLESVTPLDAALYSAGTTSFPHAKTHLNPGCTPQRTREGIIYTCAECVRIRTQLEANYDSKR